ncbi:putative sugar lactone lactonase YvrE [Cylas formicarius]|uniref:putative sugar lactone lactonase YvrE n=1 Tax=Cylas formicarius TaxID=197179 RepID=UPI002958821A|nr:putative sugar lactone lactonase YvrE [Cylas formicarius]
MRTILALAVVLLPYVQGLDLNFEQLPGTDRVAESLFWDRDEHVLYYVDVLGAQVHRYDPRNKIRTSIKIPETSVSLVVPIKGRVGEVIVAANHDLYSVHWSTRRIVKLRKPDNFKDKAIFGDGRVCVKGRLWINTYLLKGNKQFVEGAGSLYRIILHKDERFSITKVLANATFANGIDWSEDNKHMFHVGTYSRKIYKYAIDVNGSIGKREVIFDFKDHPHINGEPDGLTTDDHGNLIVAVHKGGSLLVVEPHTGELLNFLRIPLINPTGLEWGGADNRTLFIGTASEELSQYYVEKNYLRDGSVLALRGPKKGPSSRKIVAE